MSAFKRLGILFIPGVPEWIFPDILIWLFSVNHTRNPSNKIMIIISKERAISQFLDISIHRIEPSFNWSYFQITLVLKRWKLYLHKWLRYQAQLVYIYEIWSGDWVDTRLDPHFGNRAGSHIMVPQQTITWLSNQFFLCNIKLCSYFNFALHIFFRSQWLMGHLLPHTYTEPLLNGQI